MGGGEWEMEKEWKKAGSSNAANAAEYMTVLRDVIGCDLLRMAKWCTRDAAVRVSCWSARVRACLLERVEVELSCGHLTCWRPLCLELSSVAGVSLPAPPPIHTSPMSVSPLQPLSSAVSVSERLSRALFLLPFHVSSEKMPILKGSLYLSGIYRLNSFILWPNNNRLVFYGSYDDLKMKIWAE